MHKSQSLFYLTTALHVSGVTITHLQDHKTTVTTTSGNRYTVIDRINSVEITNKMQPCNRIFIPPFIEGSTCFERHTAHH